MCVGDDQHAGIELAGGSVQGGESLAVFCTADDDPSALYIAVVKGVHGLAILQHDVVGDVHDVVDGTHAHGPQPLAHPQGGGADLYVAYHPGGVPGAQVRIGSLHVQQVAEGAGPAALHLRRMEGEGGAEGGGRLPRQTDDGEAVGTVGGDLKLHHVVVIADGRPKIVAGAEVPGAQVGVAV